jgi:8-oxo-dGTP diphosphatase
MPVASCVHKNNLCRAICETVYKAMKMLDSGLWEKETKFWKMWQKPETPKVGVGVVLKRNVGTSLPGSDWATVETMVLLGLRKGAHGAGQWSLPGGHMELGESFLEVCRREVLEETGITIKDIEPLCFTNDIFETDGLHYVTLFFEAEWDKKQEPKDMEPDRTEKWKWFPLDEVPKGLFPPLKQAIKRMKK